MFKLQSSFSKIYTVIILLLFLINFNNVWANNFISRGYYVIDLSQKLEWMTCTVGMVWDKNRCVGKPIKVKFKTKNFRNKLNLELINCHSFIESFKFEQEIEIK